jgi:hypothetical protein
LSSALAPARAPVPAPATAHVQKLFHQVVIPALIKRPAMHEGYDCSNEDCITLFDQSALREKQCVYLSLQDFGY